MEDESAHSISKARAETAGKERRLRGWIESKYQNVYGKVFPSARERVMNAPSMTDWVSMLIVGSFDTAQELEEIGGTQVIEQTIDQTVGAMQGLDFERCLEGVEQMVSYAKRLTIPAGLAVTGAYFNARAGLQKVLKDNREEKNG